MDRHPYNPFEDLQEFADLKTLTKYILESVKVREVKVVLPGGFDLKLIDDPDAILPVHNILVGNATFEYIRYKADYILSSVKDRIEKVNQDNLLSFDDKLKLFKGIKKSLEHDYQYFNSMNPIRYMSSYTWKIQYTQVVDLQHTIKEELYPNSKIDLQEGHWNLIENTFLIRRHLLYEIIYLVNEELQNLEEQLTDTKYGWAKDDWEYELYEIILALLTSNRLDIVKGDEKTFVHDFLKLFGKTDERFAYYKGKILDRGKPRGKNPTGGKRAVFLTALQEYLENYGKPSTGE